MERMFHELAEQHRKETNQTISLEGSTMHDFINKDMGDAYLELRAGQ